MKKYLPSFRRRVIDLTCHFQEYLTQSYQNYLSQVYD